MSASVQADLARVRSAIILAGLTYVEGSLARVAQTLEESDRLISDQAAELEQRKALEANAWEKANEMARLSRDAREEAARLRDGLRLIVDEYENATADLDAFEDHGGHVGIARHDRAVLQGLGTAAAIARALLSASNQPSADRPATQGQDTGTRHPTRTNEQAVEWVSHAQPTADHGSAASGGQDREETG